MNDRQGSESSGHRPDRVYILVCIFFATGFLLLWPGYRNNITDDGTAYFNIAKKYASFEIKSAVVGIWSPMLPWLLTPLLWLHVPPVVGYGLLCLVAGPVLIAVFDVMLRRTQCSDFVRVSLLVVVCIQYWSYSLFMVTADVFFLVLSLLYLAVVTSDGIFGSRRYAAACGVLGASLYFCKTVGFPFFAVHFATVCFLAWVCGRVTMRKALAQYLTGMAVCIMLMVPWILALSVKLGGFTMGTAGTYIYYCAGIDKLQQPVEKLGLLPPPDDLSTSFWDDLYMPDRMFAGGYLERPCLQRSLALIAANSRKLSCIFFFFVNLVWPVVLAGSVFLAWRAQLGVERFRILVFLSAIFLLCAAYLPLAVEWRYFWTACVLMVLLSASIIAATERYLLSSASPRSDMTIKLLTVAMAASFLFSPVYILRWFHHGGDKAVQLAQALTLAGVHGKIASNGKWDFTLRTCYFGGWKFYGVPGEDQKESDFIRQLHDMSIDYVIVYEGFDYLRHPPPGFEEVTPKGLRGVRLYAGKGGDLDCRPESVDR